MTTANMLHELNVAPQRRSRILKSYTGPERRTVYRARYTPSTRAEELLIDSFVIAGEVAEKDPRSALLLHRVCENIRTALSIISYSGANDRRKGTR